MADKNLPLVTVVVPTYNNERTIEACLKSVACQAYPKIELVVVDNYSTDRTKEIACKYGTVMTKGPERSSQRNYGAMLGHGEYVLFTDSDTELAPDVVDACVKAAEGTRANAVIVSQISKGESFWAKCKILEKMCYIGDSMIEAAQFFNRQAFLEEGGFDEAIAGGGEDWDVPLRLLKRGFRIARVRPLIVHNEGNLLLSHTVRKKYYYGKTVPRYVRKHPIVARAQFIPVRMAFIRNWRSLVSDPLHACGLFLMKFCEFVAGALGIVSSIRLRHEL